MRVSGSSRRPRLVPVGLSDLAASTLTNATVSSFASPAPAMVGLAQLLRFTAAASSQPAGTLAAVLIQRGKYGR
jgi:hypothetical protein